VKAKESIALAQAEATARFRYYKQLSELPWGDGK
jgi:hypothetical protein